MVLGKLFQVWLMLEKIRPSFPIGEGEIRLNVILELHQSYSIAFLLKAGFNRLGDQISVRPRSYAKGDFLVVLTGGQTSWNQEEGQRQQDRRYQCMFYVSIHGYLSFLFLGSVKLSAATEFGKDLGETRNGYVSPLDAIKIKNLLLWV